MYVLTVTVHILATLFWLGGTFFLGIVGAPALRGLEPELRGRLFRDIGVRFRKLGWAAITVLVITGVMNLNFRGLLGPAFRGGGQNFAHGFHGQRGVRFVFESRHSLTVIELTHFAAEQYESAAPDAARAFKQTQQPGRVQRFRGNLRDQRVGPGCGVRL